jgi:pimeloyl-ACP methyl ester carboxylesterase
MTTQNVPHSDAARVKANDIEIVYDTFGDANAPPLLLISGLSAQMIGWDAEFCAQIAAQGYWVIRFDNRDVGLSTKFDDAGAPDLLALIQALVHGEALQAPYTLRDMADDAVGLLDALEIESAHVVGASMGGMIAQTVAIHHPGRVSTLTSIMSTTGDPELPPPKPEVVAVLVTPAPMDREPYIEQSIHNQRVLSGPGYPPDAVRARERAGRAFDRGIHPAGVGRQLAAIITSGSRKEALKSVSVPTLVIHGDADPLVPVEAGIDMANAVPGAQLLIIEGMGHDLPPAVWPRVIDAIARHAV